MMAQKPKYSWSSSTISTRDLCVGSEDTGTPPDWQAWSVAAP
jgi:hypothetical protein